MHLGSGETTALAYACMCCTKYFHMPGDTGQFPFKEAGDENMSQQNKLKAMFPRIVRAQYQRPTWVSHSSCHLLEGMLQPDLSKRLSVAQVLAHPWFMDGESSSGENIYSSLLISMVTWQLLQTLACCDVIAAFNCSSRHSMHAKLYTC